MGGNGGAGGSTMSDIIGLGVGLQAAGAMSGQLGGIFAGMNGQQPAQQPAPQATTVTCAKCGNPLPENAKFCLECGEKVVNLAADEIICPSCGAKTPKGKFCMECGSALARKCPKCGADVPVGGKFCLECGEKL